MSDAKADYLPMPICMLLLPEAVRLSQESLLNRLKADYPTSFHDVGGTDKGDDGGATVLTAQGLMLTLMNLPMPIPGNDLDWPTTLAVNQGWPTAKDVVAAHRGHVIVSALVRTPIDDVEAYHTHKMAYCMVAQLAAAVAAETRATAVYWGLAGMLQRPQELSAMAARAFDQTPPLELFVKFHGRRTETGAIQLGTTGLSGLIGREVQTEPNNAVDPRVIIEKLGGIVGYLMMNGPVVRDGDTLGISATEKIRARYGQTDGGQKVISLTFEQLDPAA